MAPGIVSVAGMTESILQIVQVPTDPLMPADFVHSSLPKQGRADTFRRARMKSVEHSVLHPLLIRITIPRPRIGILICSLIFISDLVSLPIFETTCLQRKVIRQIVMDIDLI